LEVSYTAWNAVVFADVINDHRHLEYIRRLTADKPEVAQLMEQLIVRKRTLFANDERLIGSWEVTRTEDGINLRADARDPHSLPRDPI
jgi:L-rhamnose mutarotase